MNKMCKKVVSLLLAAVMVLTMTAFASVVYAADEDNVEADPNFKMGVILVGDETEGYSAAHIAGVKEAAAELGLDDSQIIWKYKVPEDSSCYDAAIDLVGQGCSLVIGNSYGHQTYLVQAAQEYPDVTFVSMTGDFAAISGLENFKNAFTNIYESRYVSGVVAGLKLNEMIEAGEITEDQAKKRLWKTVLLPLKPSQTALMQTVMLRSAMLEHSAMQRLFQVTLHSTLVLRV